MTEKSEGVMSGWEGSGKVTSNICTKCNKQEGYIHLHLLLMILTLTFQKWQVKSSAGIWQDGMQGMLPSGALTAFDRYRVPVQSHKTRGHGRYRLFLQACHKRPQCLVTASSCKQIRSQKKKKIQMSAQSWTMANHTSPKTTTTKNYSSNHAISGTTKHPAQVENAKRALPVNWNIEWAVKDIHITVSQEVFKCFWPHGESFANVWDTGAVKESASPSTKRLVASSQQCPLNPITVYFSTTAITSLLRTMSSPNLTWQVAYVKKPILAASKYHKCARNHKLEGISKMSRDHSLALALSSAATCSSLKTYIWPLGMLSASAWTTFYTGCVCTSVCMPLALQDILCLSLRLLSASSATCGRADSRVAHLWDTCACPHRQQQHTITRLFNLLMDQLTPGNT